MSLRWQQILNRKKQWQNHKLSIYQLLEKTWRFDWPPTLQIKETMIIQLRNKKCIWLFLSIPKYNGNYVKISPLSLLECVRGTLGANALSIIHKVHGCMRYGANGKTSIISVEQINCCSKGWKMFRTQSKQLQESIAKNYSEWKTSKKELQAKNKDVGDGDLKKRNTPCFL